MSLAIDVDRVSEVLLPDGKWHKVIGKSFDTDAYEYMHEGKTIFGGGSAKETIPSTGARWTELAEDGNERVVFCPLTAIQAVAYRP